MALIFQSSSQNGQLSRNRLLSRFISWHIFLVHLQSQRSKSRLRTTKLKKRKPLWFPTFLLLQVEAFFLLFLRSRCGDRVTTIYRFYYCCHQPMPCFYYRQILHCVQLFRLLASIVCACDRYIFCAAAAAGSSRLLKSTVPWKSSSRVIKTCSWMNGRFALNCWAYHHQTSMPIPFIVHAGGIIMSNTWY